MKALVISAFAIVMATAAFAQTADDIAISRATVPPKIDGVLDDEAWKVTPLPMTFDQWVSYNPVRGDKMPDVFRTEVRVTYDDRNIYFAFHCFDNEPDKIRTNVSRRDSAFNDDWIAMSLDSAGTGQSAYHLFSNPSGSQMDAINTSASGEQFDADIVWYSVAKTTSDGYVVEVQVPLQTLRFKGGDKVRMGLVFFRKVSRTGVSYAWPEMLPGQWVFDRPSHIVFDNLKPRRLVELLPSVTYGVNQAREDTSSAWAEADNDAHVGVSGKFGITSGVTLDGTINPDFSQVESDQFQVTVNQRYPLFFSEKRPFFMEGMGLFNVAHGDNMRTAVHTRKIVDPIFGAKLTGTQGKTTFGVLSANDDHPGDVGDRGDEFADRNKLFTIGRATYALRRSDYVGGIFTQTQHAGRSNLAAGADLSIPPSSTQSLNASFLTTQTSDSGNGDTHGNAGTRRVRLSRRAAFETDGQVEHYDRDFQMDTAFYRRTGFTGGTSFSQVNFYPGGGQSFWIQRVISVLLREVRHGSHPGRRRILPGHRHSRQLHAPGERQHRVLARQGNVAGSAVRRSQRHLRVRRHAGAQVVERLRRHRLRPGDLLRRGRSVPGTFDRQLLRLHDSAEPAPVGELRRQFDAIRSRLNRRARLQRGRVQLADDVSVQQALPGALPGAVR